MSGVKTNGAALRGLGSRVRGAADDIRFGSAIQDPAEGTLGSTVVSSAVGSASKQQAQRATMVADEVHHVGSFPDLVDAGLDDWDASRAAAAK
jgi:hypothetical protein